MSALHAVGLLEAGEIGIDYVRYPSRELKACIYGCSIGFIDIILICHIADNVTKNYRGSAAANIPLISFVISLTSNVPSNFKILLVIVLSMLTWFITSDPVTYFLKSNDNFKAEQIFKNSNKGAASRTVLQSEIGEVIETFQEEKTNDSAGYLNIFGNGNWKPIGVLSLLGILLVVAMKILELLFVHSFANIEKWIQNGKGSPSINYWIQIEEGSPFINYYYYFLLIIIVTLIISKLVSDVVGRKILFWIGGIGCIVSSLFYVINSTITNFNADYEPNPIMENLIAFGFYISVHLLMPLLYIYECESFPLSKRNASLACVSIARIGVELIVQNFDEFFNSEIRHPLRKHHVRYLWAWVIGILILVPVVGCFLPETKRLTLRQSRNKFNNYWERRQPQPNANIQTNIKLC